MWCSSLEQLTHCRDQRCHPVVAYGKAISAQKQSADWQLALALLDELSVKTLQGNAVVSGATAHALSGASASSGGSGASGGWGRQLGLLTEMRQSGFESSVIACSSVTDWRRCAELLGEVSRGTLRLDSAAFNASLPKVQWRRARHYLQALAAAGLGNRTTRNICAAARWTDALLLAEDLVGHSNAVAGASWAVAQQLLGHLQESLQPDLIVYNATISACGQHARWREAVHWLQSLPRRNLRASDASLGAFASAVPWARALALGARQRLPLAALGAALGTCVRSDSWEQALLMHSQLRETLQGNLLTYNSAVSACEEGGNWELALALMAEMQEVVLRMDIITYNSAISAAEKCGRWQEAVALLSELRGKELRGDVVTYSSAMKACGHRWQLALSLMAREELAEPNAIACALAVAACCRGNLRGACLLRLVQLQRLGTRVQSSYNKAITACRGDHWQHALVVRRRLEFLGDIDIVSDNAGLSVLRAAGKWVISLQLLATTQLRRLSPSIVSFSSSGGAWALGAALLEEAEKRHLRLDARALQGGRWQQILQSLDLLQPNRFLFSAAMGSDWGRSLLLLRRLEESHLQLDAVPYQCQSPWTTALQLFAAGRQQGLAPVLPLRSAASGWRLLLFLGEQDAAARSCVEHAQWREALLLMEKQALRPEVCVEVVIACCQLQQWQQALHLLSTIDRRSALVAYHALASCLPTSDWPTALQVVARLGPSALQQDVVSYNTLMNLSSWPAALVFLAELSSRALRSNLITCNTLITSDARHWPYARGLLTHFKASGLQADVVSYNAAAFASPWRQALSLLRATAASTLRLTVASCSTAIAAADSSESAWRWALLLLLEATRRALDSLVAQNAATGIVAKASWPFALARLAPSEASFGANLGCSHWSRSLQLLKQSAFSATRPNLIMHNAAAGACARAKGRQSGAWRALLLSLRSDLTNLVTFSEGITACSHQLRWTQAAALLSRCLLQGLLPDLTSRNEVMAACRGAGAAAAALRCGAGNAVGHALAVEAAQEEAFAANAANAAWAAACMQLLQSAGLAAARTVQSIRSSPMGQS
ncbi:unnamed protein product [Effrenium voratum]|uniref:Pentatricopeptide repeat-containing protein, chloroplastic n=1 Tax=Effrenium voratum TaxID=2562239 RepID=A0AA36IPS0_9DINO|nr:unnamed protein product [Effrenium voratum]